MIRLAIDTTSEACSVALDSGSDILQRYQHAPRQHGELLLPWVDELLAEAGITRNQLDAVCVTRGPGSFTSLRMGFSVALGIAGALDVPVYPVSGLQTLAVQAVRHGANQVIAALDARMREVYIASYIKNMDGYPELIGEEQLIAPGGYRLPDSAGKAPDTSCTTSWHGIGNGFVAEQGALSEALQGRLSKLEPDNWPMARDVLILADKVTPVAADKAELIYLRNKVVQT